jgi:DnaJ-class molecular chaperone
LIKPYYKILQVDPQAEQEVIDAAYRRLMLKYHPDVLSPEERNSEEVLKRVQDLNEAYEVLGDWQKRQAYDLDYLNYDRQARAFKIPSNETSPLSVELESRIYLVKCSKTKRTFKMFLGRRKGWGGPFVVMGFEALESQPEEEQKKNGKRLSSVLKEVFLGKHSSPQTPIKEMLPTPDEINQNLFDTANTLSMGEIEWAGHKCPDCAGESINPNGTIGTWSRCGTCHRLKCAGNAKKRIDGYYSTCHWCGATNKTTRSVSTGSKEQAILRGKYSETSKQDLPKLSDQDSRLLNDQ